MGNLNEKVGTLRNFIKELKPKAGSLKGRIDKHPKNLKVIGQTLDH